MCAFFAGSFTGSSTTRFELVACSSCSESRIRIGLSLRPSFPAIPRAFSKYCFALGVCGSIRSAVSNDTMLSFTFPSFTSLEHRKSSLLTQLRVQCTLRRIWEPIRSLRCNNGSLLDISLLEHVPLLAPDAAPPIYGFGSIAYVGIPLREGKKSLVTWKHTR